MNGIGEIYQVVGQMQAAGDGYGAISGLQSQTSDDDMHMLGGTGVSWTDPTFMDVHGRATELNNEMHEESQLNARRQAGMYSCVDSTNSTSSTCSAIALSL